MPGNSDLSFWADVLHGGVAYYRIRSEGLAETAYALGTRTLLWFGHGCSGYRTQSDRERHYGLGMDALVIGCTRNANVIMI